MTPATGVRVSGVVLVLLHAEEQMLTRASLRLLLSAALPDR
jgi:hypothetical protein